MILEDLLSECDYAMHQLGRADFWPFACASALLWYIGRHVAGSDFRRQKLGWQAGYLSFLGYCIFSYVDQGFVTGETLIHLIVRGVLFGGGVAGVAWIASPFLLVIVSVCRRTIGELKKWGAILADLLARPMRARRARRQAAVSKQRSEELAEKNQKSQEQEAVRRQAELKAQTLREEQKRAAELHCIAVRHACELAYNKYRPGIAARWPESKFKKYLDAYLIGTLPKEVLDRHAEEIKKVIDHHAERLADESELSGARSIDELNARMEEQRKSVRAMEISPDMIEELICEIDQAFQERARSIIGKL